MDLCSTFNTTSVDDAFLFDTDMAIGNRKPYDRLALSYGDTGVTDIDPTYFPVFHFLREVTPLLLERGF